jgi:S-formylglutathione hydrolase
MLALAQQDLAAELRLGALDSEAIGRPVECAVLLPESERGSVSEEEGYPLVLLLHGAGGDRLYIERERPLVTEMWESGALPRFVMATASVPPGTIYMDDVHGIAKWETFMMREFLPHLRSTYPVSAERKMTLITGISMGGAGSARLAFKYPEEFGAVAMMEAGVWAGTSWAEVPDHLKIRTAERRAALFGDPFDADHWEANNPASIVADNPARIREAGIEIYIECGDMDGFGFHENAEFLHRLLWDEKIPHEFRLVRWADHVGSTLAERSRDRFDFVARYLGQPAPTEPDVERFRSNRARRYREMGYEPFPFWPNEPRPVDP